MKSFSLLVSLIALVSLGSSCTFTTMVHSGQGRVIISAQGPKKANGHPVIGHRNLARTQGHTLAPSRNLSASTDIDAITYTVIDLADGSVYEEGEVDLYYLSIELLLPPGGNFRIIVDVDINDTAPGTNVGVTRYGDQADFVVDEYYDTYVDLTVHPNQSLVFDAASVVAGTPSTIRYLDPTVATLAPATKDLSSASLTANQADRVFYGPDADLYYFNKTANAVYRWTNIANVMTASDVVLTGATGTRGMGDDEITLYAACADPSTSDTLWVVGKNTVDGEWYYYAVDISGSPSVSASSPITESLRGGLGSTATPVPTSIAVDSTYSDVYLTYYTSNGTGAESGVLQFYGDELYAQFPDPLTVGGASSSIFTDVVWDQGKVWVFASPNTGVAGAAANTGKATIYQFDDYLEPLDFVVGSRTYSGTLPALSTATTQLVLPSRFTGPVQSRKIGTSQVPVLFFQQQDFQSGGAHVLSQLNLNNNGVTSY